MEVVGYVYNADTYCPDCTLEMIRKRFPVASEGKDSIEDIAEALQIDFEDEHTYDSDSFPKVILDTSESGDSPEACGRCHTVIENSWTGEAMDEAVGFMREYVTTGQGNVKFIDECYAYMDGWHNDEPGTTVMEMYNERREWEKKEQHGGTLV